MHFEETVLQAKVSIANKIKCPTRSPEISNVSFLHVHQRKVFSFRGLYEMFCEIVLKVLSFAWQNVRYDVCNTSFGLIINELILKTVLDAR